MKSYDRNKFVYQFLFLLKCLLGDVGTSIWIKIIKSDNSYTVNSISLVSIIIENKELTFDSGDIFTHFDEVLGLLKYKGFTWKLSSPYALCAKIKKITGDDGSVFTSTDIIRGGKLIYDKISDKYLTDKKKKSYCCFTSATSIC